MANMSYCRFENTCSDLADCVCALRGMVEDEEKNLSKSEERFRKNMKELCEEYLGLCEEYEEME